MKNKLYMLTLFVLISCTDMTAQQEYDNLKKYSNEELKEDVFYLKRLLTEGHPGLYWYSSQNDFEKSFNQIVNSLNDSLTELEFLNKVALLNNVIKCSHSDIRPSNDYNDFWKDSVNLIPFNIMRVNSDYFIYQNLSDHKELHFGTKLISINDIPIEEIVKHLLPYIPSDGDNQTRKYHALKNGFYRYYSYYRNSTTKEFKIRYENEDGKSSEILTEGLKKVAFDEKRMALNQAHSKQSPIVFEVLDSNSTAVLKIRSFRSDLMEKKQIVFEDYIQECFEQIQNSKTKNLIVDLRGNGGGYSEYAAVLFSFLTDSTFQYCKKQTVTTDRLIDGIDYDIPKTFNGFPEGIIFKNGQFIYTKHSVLGWRKPSEPSFSGNVYFLIDGECSSTTSELASLAQDQNIGTFIGQEVGGCFMGNTGGVLGWFELPNSKLKVRIGMVKYEMVNSQVLNKQGVLPDFEVNYTVEDIIQGNDLEMKVAFEEIKKHDSKEDNMLEKQIDELTDSVYNANKDALGILIHVESPSNNLSWTKAIGFSDSSRTDTLLVDQPLLIASNTKTYVAAAILRLAEKEKIGLDQSIKNLVSLQTKILLERDGYNLNKITIRHLLSHTSGIHDYVNDDYFQFVIEHPKYEWSRDEQIKRAVEIGQPLSTPGTKFHYGDINYLLLTEIIETKEDKPFQIAIKELLKFKELGVNCTWFKNLDTEPENINKFAHQYAYNFRWDSYEINPSWDLFGGGGIAATVKDAALFYQYLFEGKVIQNDSLLNEMYSHVLPEEESKYCLGIYHFDFGFNLYYHGGWWGTDVNYSPETKTSIAVFTLVKEKRTEINPFLGKKIHEMVK